MLRSLELERAAEKVLERRTLEGICGSSSLARDELLGRDLNDRRIHSIGDLGKGILQIGHPRQIVLDCSPLGGTGCDAHFVTQVEDVCADRSKHNAREEGRDDDDGDRHSSFCTHEILFF